MVWFLALGTIAATVGAASILGVAPPPADSAQVDTSVDLLEDVALNPNISIGSCAGGGAPVRASSGMATARVDGSFRGDVAPGQYFDNYNANSYYCSGYVPPQAQICLHVDGGGASVRIEVTASDDLDTVMFIEGLNNDLFLCDDDGGYDLRSRIDAFFEPGDYAIYIGSYSQGYGGNFIVEVDNDTYY